MDKEARATDFQRSAGNGGVKDCNSVVDVDDDYEYRVIEWEHGLPDCHDLTPLSQALIPPGLALAFSITPEPSRTVADVARASQGTLSLLCSSAGAGASSQAFSTTNDRHLRALDVGEDGRDPEDMIVDRLDDDGSNKKQPRRSDSAEEVDSVMDGSKGTKRPRLVWTPQLHKRFVDVVSHLGITNAVPKTIMQLMNVEGLTRENVASHLQKYRLYLKRMHGGGGDGGDNMTGNGGSDGGMATAVSSASDQLFASVLVPPRSMNNENRGVGGVGGSGGHSHGHNGTCGSYENGNVGNGHMQMPMMIGYSLSGGMAGMPVYGMYGGGHVGMQMEVNHRHHHQYGAMVPNPPQSGASGDK